MAVEVKHATQATGTPAGNGEIAKDEWNEAHTVTGLGTMAEEDAADYYTAAEADAAFEPIGAAAAVVESEAYGPTWDGDTTHAPAKNDVYDILEKFFPTPVSGGIVIGNAINSTWGITSLTVADTIYYVPLWNFRRRTVTGLGCRISAGVADSNIRIAILSDSNFSPATPLGETGNISSASATTVVGALSGSDFVMEAFTLYWAAYWFSHSSLRLVGNQQAGYWSQHFGDATAGNLIQTGNCTGFHYESGEAFGSSFPDAGSETLSKVTTATRIFEPALLIDEA